MSMSALADRLARVEEEIARACEAAGRRREDVRLVAVSKTHPPALLREAYALGVRDFGESYAKELDAKRQALQDLPDIRWHFVGRVQRNKAKLLRGVHLVHGAGRVGHVEALGAKAAPVDVLLQVNEAGEEQKNGFDPDELRRDLPVVSQVEGARVRGLMTLPPLGEDPKRTRQRFASLRRLRDELEAAHGVSLPELSMGMSGDFPLAIREGATLVRVGTAIFGPR